MLAQVLSYRLHIVLVYQRGSSQKKKKKAKSEAKQLKPTKIMISSRSGRGVLFCLAVSHRSDSRCFPSFLTFSCFLTLFSLHLYCLLFYSISYLVWFLSLFALFGSPLQGVFAGSSPLLHIHACAFFPGLGRNSAHLLLHLFPRIFSSPIVPEGLLRILLFGHPRINIFHPSDSQP